MQRYFLPEPAGADEPFNSLITFSPSLVHQRRVSLFTHIYGGSFSLERGLALPLLLMAYRIDDVFESRVASAPVIST